VGQNNFFDRYQTMWSISSTEGTGRSESWDWATWRRNWTESSGSDSLVWKGRHWMTRPFSDLTASDFALDRQIANNPAVGGATNFTDAGANLDALPRPAP